MRVYHDQQSPKSGKKNHLHDQQAHDQPPEHDGHAPHDHRAREVERFAALELEGEEGQTEKHLEGNRELVQHMMPGLGGGGGGADHKAEQAQSLMPGPDQGTAFKAPAGDQPMDFDDDKWRGSTPCGERDNQWCPPSGNPRADGETEGYDPWLKEPTAV